MTATATRWAGALIVCLLAACQQLATVPQSGDASARSARAVSQPAAEPSAAAVNPVRPVALPTVQRHASTPPTPDLWNDIRASFQLDHRTDRRRVQQELVWLKRHPSYLKNLQPRMERFLAHIHAEVAARGMPGELALLPIIESAMDPYAFSHGGAAGLWQFIPGTAKRFGLARNWWVDGRRDPVASTDAALDYLEYLHGLFNDWPLAIASYNAGEGNVSRAVRRAPAGSEFWNLRLPKETSAYVPRLLALAAVVADPAEYGIELPQLSPAIPFIVVDTHAQFDLMKAAATLGTDIDTLYAWNPNLNQWATPPAGPNRLLLPAAGNDNAQALISAVPAAERVQWLRINVKPGDTLSHIATRYGTDVATLRRANRLNGNNIRSGQALLIPKSAQAMAAYPAVARSGSTGGYVVQQGDSLWSVSRAHGVALASLIKANQIGPQDVLRPGTALTIPGHGPLPQRSSKVIRKVRYGVRSGDSLAKIASKFNVSVAEIAGWNELNVKKYLQPGQSLLVYVDVAAGD